MSSAKLAAILSGGRWVNAERHETLYGLCVNYDYRLFSDPDSHRYHRVQIGPWYLVVSTETMGR